ncbi:LEA type 2 family protein [Ferruginibacter sp.]|uniref:NDR1/HIN1-like protein n=1 Tax=Ferruginibacter sp. TaxID=1940288 RepID=UPI002659EE63|nr:LEA type 2 family protein [Ferruginibacter sp.]
MEKIGFSATSLKMDLIYYNPNNFGLELNRTDLDVYINNNYLGRTEQVYRVSIPKREEFAIPIKIDVDMKNLLKNGLATFLTNEVMVKITGTIRVGKLNVFKTFTVNYEGKQQFTAF